MCCDLPVLEQYYNCDGLCLNDSDGDGVCDELEISGCTDSTKHAIMMKVQQTMMDHVIIMI